MQLEELKEIVDEVGNYCECKEDYYCYYCYCRSKLKDLEQVENAENRK